MIPQISSWDKLGKARTIITEQAEFVVWLQFVFCVSQWGRFAVVFGVVVDVVVVVVVVFFSLDQKNRTTEAPMD